MQFIFIPFFVVDFSAKVGFAYHLKLYIILVFCQFVLLNSFGLSGPSGTSNQGIKVTNFSAVDNALPADDFT